MDRGTCKSFMLDLATAAARRTRPHDANVVADAATRARSRSELPIGPLRAAAAAASDESHSI